jgi:hypothetical protein
MKRLLTILIICAVIVNCKKPFDPPQAALDESVLIIEGVIAVGDNGENIFTLSKLRTLQDKATRIPELKAKVSISSANGNNWVLSESGRGIYTSVLSLPENGSYKLMIQTANGKQYESALEKAIITPAIDSVTWKQPDGLDLYVHAHDQSNNTRYYRWEYIETFERHSWIQSELDFVNGQVISRPLGDQIYSCWKDDSSKSIIINNTISLSSDVVSYQPLTSIYRSNDKLSVRYSILVKQIGMTKEAYNFWSILKKNTELTGTLFDPQPSKMPSNIRCTNDDTRKVVGYISVAKITEKRIFIRNSAMNVWPSQNEADNCPVISKRPAESIALLKKDTTLAPAYFETLSGALVIASRYCVDCRITKGTNTKPSFW